MKVTVSAKELTDAIKDIQKGIDQVQALTLSASKGLTITAQNAGRVLAVRVKDAQVEEKGSFTVKPEILTGILKNRKDITLELKGNDVSFKAPSSKAYSGNFVTLPAEKVSVESESTDLDFSEDFVASLNTIVAAVSINDVHLGKQNPLPIFVKLSEKGAEFSCCNDSHIAYARTKKGKFKKDSLMCLPAGTIPLINALARNGTYKMAVTQASVFAANDAFRYRVPLEQFDQAISLDDAKGLLKQLKGEKVAGSIKVRVGDLSKTMDNLMSVYEENVPVEFLIKEGALRARTKTNYGSVADGIKGKDAKDMKSSVNVHPQVLNDILTRIKAEVVSVTVIGEKCLLIEANTDDVEYTYSCILL